MAVVKIKKKKAQKNDFIKRKLKSESYKNCLEATQLENKINYLEKKINNVDSRKKDHRKLKKEP